MQTFFISTFNLKFKSVTGQLQNTKFMWNVLVVKSVDARKKLENGWAEEALVPVRLGRCASSSQGAPRSCETVSFHVYGQTDGPDVARGDRDIL